MTIPAGVNPSEVPGGVDSSWIPAEPETASTTSKEVNRETLDTVYEALSVDVPTSYPTSTEVQEAWNEQMLIISEIVTGMNAQPPTVTGDDLYVLLDALNELVDLAMNGITDENGVTYYLTERMVTALKVLLIEFAKSGITPNMTVPQDDPLAILMAAANPGVDPYDDPLQIAVIGALGLTYEDLALQSYLYTTIMNEVLPIFGAQFEDLYEYIEITDRVIQTLNNLLLITTYVSTEDPWVSSLELNNPGDISPDSAEDISNYILMNTDPNDKDDAYARGFGEAYNEEMRQAQANAEANGTTVQYEMAQLQGGYGSSTDRLKVFLKDNPQAVEDISEIIAENNVEAATEVIPTAPEGSTMTEVGEDLWGAKEDLDLLIEELSAIEGMDPKLIESLEQISSEIDAAWDKTVQIYLKYGHDLGPEPYTPESIKTHAPELYEGFMRDFATFYIEDAKTSKSGGSTVSHIEDAISRFQTLSSEQLQELQKLMAVFDMIMRAVGEMMKIIHDASMNIIRNYNR